jgi:hypothetical protein
MRWTKTLTAATLPLLLATAAVAVAPAPANAAAVALTDDSGDTLEPGLDFTAIRERNTDRAVVARITFARDRRSEIIIAVRPRHHAAETVRIVAVHRREGEDRIFLIDNDSEKVTCGGLRSTWDRDTATMKMRLPSRCVNGGDYGAIRSWFLTEGFGGGGDVDYAPENGDGGLGWTPWIARG